MCLILLSNNHHPIYKLVVAANRDEFYQRPTQQADYWEEDPAILGGRDKEAGGTWMGINRKGRISMLTNYRDLSNIKQDAPSRGHLVSEFLKNGQPASDYLHQLESTGKEYNGYNIICGDIDNLYYYGNYQQGVHLIPGGVHGLSNALLDTAWPKVEKGKKELSAILDTDKIDPESIFDLLYDDRMAPGNQLPGTGVGLEMEKMLSPIFIKSPDYGSRCSTVLLVDQTGQVFFAERTYNTTDFSYVTKTFRFRLG